MPYTFLLTIILSCCSVMWSNNLKGNMSFRFILSGGTIMTIISELQKVSAGAGVCGLHRTNDSGA